jgi:hypothetical protein
MSTPEQAPPARAPKNAFDEGDRDRLRATLFRYMEAHDIGVPTLIAHMSKAVKREQRFIPQKTLQRFLEGRMRTNDATVRIFHDFAQTLPAARDDMGELTLAFRQFFEASVAKEQTRSAPIPLGLFKTYLVPPGSSNPASAIHAGYLEITARPQGAVHLGERFFMRPTEQSGQDPDSRGEYFEGVLLAFETFQVGVLRSTASRRPRIHWFMPRKAGFDSLCQSNPPPLAALPMHFHPADQAYPPKPDDSPVIEDDVEAQLDALGSAAPREGQLADLHLAIAMNDLASVRHLVDVAGASFKPDRFGRLPSVIAAQCNVSEELSDYILEKEAAATADAK